MISTITPIIRNVCLIVSLLSVSALWAEPVKVGDFYYELAAEGKTATLTPSTEYTKMTQVNIPGSIDVDGTAYTVTAIGANAFKSAKLTHLTIGEGVTTVSDNAFYMCRALSEVQFPSTLTGVGKSAFYYCTSIKALVLPDKLTDIGQKAFSYLSSMEELTLPANMTEIGNSAFSGCSKLAKVNWSKVLTTIKDESFRNCGFTSLTLPETITVIDAGAFRSCASMTEVTLPSQLTEIGSSVFDSCSKLAKVNWNNSITAIQTQSFRKCAFTSLTLPSTVTAIGAGAFSGCASMTEITLPSQLTEISDQTFYQCTALATVKLPATIKRLGNAAFYECKSMESIDFPASLTAIDQNCFYGCEKLNNVKWPANITTIPSATFYKCASLTNIEIPETVTEIGDAVFRECEKLASIKLPSKLTKISKNCFGFCTSLKSVDIPAPVTTICDNAFYQSGLESLNISAHVDSIGDVIVLGCTNLPAINVDPANPKYASVDGVLVDKAVSVLLAYPAGKKGDYVMPETITEIAGWSCQQSPNITNFKFSKNLKKIGPSAFYACANMTNLEFPETLEEIGSTAFFYCSGVKSIKLPNRQVFIGNNALSVVGVPSLLFPETQTSIGIDSEGKGTSIMAMCQAMEWISLPSTLTAMRPFASSCNQMKTIYSFAPVPPALDSKGATPISMTMTIKVPKGCADAYEAAWKTLYPNATFEAVLPNGLTATVNNGAATLSWEVYSDGVWTGTPVKYDVTLTDADGKVLTQTLDGDKVSGTAMSASFSGVGKTLYTYEVKGYSSLGQLTVYHKGELDGSTGIEDVTATEAVDEVYYDLTGRVVAYPVAGNIYVVKKTYSDGRISVEKVLVK